MNPLLYSLFHTVCFQLQNKICLQTMQKDLFIILETPVKICKVSFVVEQSSCALCKVHLMLQSHFRLSNVQYFLQRISTLNVRNKSVKYTLYLFQSA